MRKSETDCIIKNLAIKIHGSWTSGAQTQLPPCIDFFGTWGPLSKPLIQSPTAGLTENSQAITVFVAYECKYLPKIRNT